MWGAERALLEELIIRCDKCSELKNQNKSSYHQVMQFVLRESRNISQLERIDCANKFCRMLCVTGTRHRPQASSWASAASPLRLRSVAMASNLSAGKSSNNVRVVCGGGNSVVRMPAAPRA